MDTSDNAHEENRRLRKTMRDLVALSTLPAVWVGLGAEGIARSLADVLLNTLLLDLVYVRLAGRNGEDIVEIVRSRHGADAAHHQAVKASLAPLCSADITAPPATIPDPFGAGALQVAVTRFGIGENQGIVIAASRDADFPTEHDRLLLSVGANQTAIVVQRRQAEEQVQQHREWLRITLASIGDAVIATDSQGRVTFLNSVAESLTGWCQAEAEGQPLETVFTILNEQTRQPVENPVEKVLREGVIVGLANHTVLVAKDGRERPVDDSAAPIRDSAGRMIGAVLTFRDVTEQRRAEARLREQELRTRTILESITDAFCALDRQWRFTYVNHQAEVLLGRSRGDLLGKCHWDEYPDMVGTDFERNFRRAVAEGITVTFEVFYAPHDRWYEIHAYPSHDGLSVYFKDVSKRKQAEEALRDADRRKDEFLATLAHELRNPLAPLRNGLQILRLMDSSNGTVAEARSMMERQLCQMVRLVDDLLDVSRITRNKLELRKQRVDLSAVIQSAIETSRPLIEQAGHDLSLSLPPVPVYLDADATRLAQVFSNLLNNSAKYTEPRGRISLVAEVVDGLAVVRVRDNGLGIPADALPRIFEMFSQVDRTMERAQGGLGLGLTLVRRLVELHEGTVEARSDGPGRGSEFIVRLPVAAGGLEHECRSTGDIEATAVPKRRIMIVDDNQDAAMTLGIMLKIMGHETRIAHDGLAAIEAAADFRPDMILLDLGLPKLSGYDVCRRLREQPWSNGMVIVALTGWAQEEDRRRTAEAGFDHHFVKPVELVALQELLARPPTMTYQGSVLSAVESK